MNPILEDHGTYLRIGTSGGRSFLIDTADWERVKHIRWTCEMLAGQPRVRAGEVWGRIALAKTILGTDARAVIFLNSDYLDFRFSNLEPRSSPAKKFNEVLAHEAGIAYFWVNHKSGPKLACVDTADWDRISPYCWWAKESHKAGAQTLYYACSDISRRKIRLHKFLIEPNSKESIDHKDNNGLNNSRENLRICTHSQNMANARRRYNVNNRYRGVSYDKARNQWAARLNMNNSIVFRKRFDTELEAAQAYNEQALIYFGEFARLNDLSN